MIWIDFHKEVPTIDAYYLIWHIDTFWEIAYWYNGRFYTSDPRKSSNCHWVNSPTHWMIVATP